MSAAINQEDLLGTFIPDVFISQIVLETTGVPLVDNNPHINANSEKVINPQVRNENLLITIKLILKEKLSNDVLGNWLDKIDLQKYLRLKIIQSTDQKTTALLSLSQDMLELVDKNVHQNDVRMRTAASVFDTDSALTVINKIQTTTKIQTLQINNKELGTKIVDDDGNEVFNINYTVKFNLSNSFPEHLAYFAISSFDVQQLAQDFHLEYDTISLNQMNGKVVSDIVIDNGDLVDLSYVFYDPNGKIWAGAVHLTESGVWRSKSTEEEGSVDLTRDTVTNNKIQDFRNIADIQKLQFDFSNIDNKLGEIEIRSSSNDKIDPYRLDEYFSDMLLTSDMNGDTKFFFTVNYEKLITDFSLYGGLIKKSGSRFIQEMMKQTKIKQMKVIRRRVKSSTGVSRFGILEGAEIFDQDEPNEVVGLSGEKEFGKFRTNNSQKGSLREVFPILNSIQDGVRHFTGMDKEMSDITDGYYQYGIEFDIDDGSVEFFKDKVNDLRDAQAELTSYYNEASKLSMKKFIQEIQNPHIKHPSEKAGRVEKIEGNFDFDSNRFTQKFINQMTSKYSGRNLRAAPWIAPITIYADTLDMFTDAFQSRRDRSVVLNSLFNYTSPRTGNPSGILAVLKLMDSLIFNLESIVGTSERKSPKRSSGSVITTSNLHSGRNTKRSIKLSKFFKSVFDSNTIKGVGLDYLSNGHDDTTNDDGLKIIQGDQFVTRINSETLRFFKDIDLDINLNTADNQITTKDKISNTSFSFLAPSRIDLPRKSISLLDQVGIPKGSSKKKRVLENINDGKDNVQEKMAHLHSTLLLQNLTSKPIAAMFDKFGKSKSGANNSQNAIEEMLDELLSEHGSITVIPIELELVQDKDNNISFTKINKIVPKFNQNFSNLADVLQTKTAETQNIKIFNEIENSGKNGFMSSLTQGLVKNGTTNKKKSDLQKSNTRSSEHIFSKPKTSPDLVSILDPKKLTVLNTSIGAEKTIAGFQKSVTEKTIKELPNHLKSIMLFNLSHGSVKFNKLNNLNFGNSIKKTDQMPENQFNFEMLKQIERLVGFEKAKSGDILIKKPLWKTLTKQDYETLVGKEIVCRMIKYENKDIGITNNKGLDNHSYDNYFILIPQQTRVNVPTITPPSPLKNIDLIEKIRITLNDNFPGLQVATKDKKRTNKELIFSNLASNLTIVDTQQTEQTSRSDKRKVRIKNKNFDIPTNLAVDALTLDCQSSNIPSEHLNSNIITLKNFDRIIQNPNILKTISDKQKLRIQELDEIDNDRCSIFGKFRPNGKICTDK